MNELVPFRSAKESLIVFSVGGILGSTYGALVLGAIGTIAFSFLMGALAGINREIPKRWMAAGLSFSLFGVLMSMINPIGWHNVRHGLIACCIAYAIGFACYLRRSIRN